MVVAKGGMTSEGVACGHYVLGGFGLHGNIAWWLNFAWCCKVVFTPVMDKDICKFAKLVGELSDARRGGRMEGCVGPSGCGMPGELPCCSAYACRRAVQVGHAGQHNGSPSFYDYEVAIVGRKICEDVVTSKAL